VRRTWISQLAAAAHQRCWSGAAGAAPGTASPGAVRCAGCDGSCVRPHTCAGGARPAWLGRPAAAARVHGVHFCGMCATSMMGHHASLWQSSKSHATACGTMWADISTSFVYVGVCVAPVLVQLSACLLHRPALWSCIPVWRLRRPPLCSCIVVYLLHRPPSCICLSVGCAEFSCCPHLCSQNAA